VEWKRMRVIYVYLLLAVSSLAYCCSWFDAYLLLSPSR
jgi:hypothetical protein